MYTNAKVHMFDNVRSRSRYKSLFFYEFIQIVINMKNQGYTKSKMRKKWWLCRATDFQSLMYPCFVCCRIFGILPYKLNASTFEASKPRYILSSIIICVCCVGNVTLAYNIIISNLTFGDLTKNLHAVTYYTFSSFIMITTHALSGPRMSLLQTIMKISLKLPSESYQKMSKLIHVKDIVIVILRIASIYINFSKVQSEFNCFFVFMVVLVTYVALMILHIIMMYINCVCVIKACFKEINDDLMHMQRQMINDIKPSVPRFICQRNQLLLIKLKTIQKRHLMISDAAQMLNILFSPQLLATTVLSFSVITFELYFYIVWQNGTFIQLNRYFLDMLLTTIAYNVIIITLLVWACETGKNQAQKIGTTIHDLLNVTSDEKIKYELQLFSLQILHRQNIFLVKGLNIDTKLLTAMVGNIITHLVILIQFLNISHSCDRKTAIDVR